MHALPTSRRQGALRVAHLIAALEQGGAETMLAKIVRQPAPDIEHTVISMADEGLLGQELLRDGIPVQALGMQRGSLPLGRAVRLARTLRELRPDLLSCWMYHANLAGLLAGGVAGVPRILWGIRCSDMDWSRYSTLTHAVVRAGGLLSDLPEAILVNSHAGAAVHQQWGYRGNRMRVIPNGFDVERFRPDEQARIAVRRELGLPDSALLVGLFARFDPMKDHLNFMQAAGIVSWHVRDAHFVLAGQGVAPENRELAQMVEAEGIAQRVHLLGVRRDMPRLTAALDVGCLSSAWGEGFSNSLGEAMASGVPCVATDVGDARIIVGDTGRIVPPKDPVVLAAALLELLSWSPEQRSTVGQAARAMVKQHYSIQAIVNVFHDVFRGPEAVGARGKES